MRTFAAFGFAITVFASGVVNGLAVGQVETCANGYDIQLNWPSHTGQKFFIFYRRDLTNSWQLLAPNVTASGSTGTFVHVNGLLLGTFSPDTNRYQSGIAATNYDFPPRPWDSTVQQQIAGTYPGILPALPWSEEDQISIVQLDAASHASTNSTNASGAWNQAGSNTVTSASGFYRVLAYDEDEDGDRLSNYAEMVRGTDPFNADTDGDGISDGDEAANGSNPLSANTAAQAPRVRIKSLTYHLNSVEPRESYDFAVNSRFSFAQFNGAVETTDETYVDEVTPGLGTAHARAFWPWNWNWPCPSDDCTNLLTGSGSVVIIVNNATNSYPSGGSPPYLIPEYADQDYEDDVIDGVYYSSYSYHADAKLELYTGWVPGVWKTRLYKLQAWAESSSRAIADSNITVLGKTLGAESAVYTAQPDARTVDVTPQVSTSADYYKFGTTLAGVGTLVIEDYLLGAIDDATTTIWVGQSLDMIARLDGLTLPTNAAVSYVWTVAGAENSFASYEPTNSQNQLVLNYPTTNANIGFSWKQEGTYDVTVAMTVTINGQVSTVLAATKFLVLRPKPTALSVTTLSPSPVTTYPLDGPGVDWEMLLGNSDPSAFSKGVKFEASFPSNVGEWAFCQIVVASDIYISSSIVVSNLTFTNCIHSSGSGVDVGGGGTWNYTAGLEETSISLMATDSPHEPLAFGMFRVKRDDAFELYLMFRPNAGGYFVPIKTVNWSWGGKAILQSNTNYQSGYEWNLSPAHGSSTPSPGQSRQGQDTSNFPQWTNAMPAGLVTTNYPNCP